MIRTPLQLVPPTLGEQISSNLGVTIAIVVLYALVFAGISILARRRFSGSVTDHLVANRSLGWFVTAVTILATGFSGVGIAGFPGTVYGLGAPFLLVILVGFSATAPVMWFLGRRMWRLGNEYGFETPGDLLGEYYGSDAIRVYSALISAAFNIIYTVAQLLAGGILISVLSGGIVAFELGLIIMAVIVFSHVVLTGVRGIAYLDTFNGVLITVVLVLFGGFIVSTAGGLANIFNALPEPVRSGHISLPSLSGAFTPEVVLLFGIFFTFGTWLMSPAVWIRVYSFDKPRNIVKVVATVLGFLAISYIPGIYLVGEFGASQLPDVRNPDFVSSLLAFEVLPFALAALFLTAVLAAVISTADSYLHSMAATFTRDIVKAVADEDMSDKRELQINYAVIFVTTAVSIGFALFYPSLLTTLAAFAGAFTVMLLPALVGAVAWPRANTPGALAGLVAGHTLVLIYQFNLVAIPNPFPVPLAPGLIVGLAANVVLLVSISYAMGPVSRERIEKFHGYLAQEL